MQFAQRSALCSVPAAAFINYNVSNGLHVSTSPIVTADWKANSSDRRAVPLGGGMGKIVRFRRLPVNFQTQALYNVEKPQSGRGLDAASAGAADVPEITACLCRSLLTGRPRYLDLRRYCVQFMPLYSTDHEILETALSWLKLGHRPALVTVIRTWGSSPRPLGSLMLMRDDGVYSGSVSGGCVEEDLIARYRDRQLSAAFPTLIDYGINRAEATRLGLPCGGRLELLVEQLDSPAPLQMLLDRIEANALTARRVCLSTGEVSLHPAPAGGEFGYSDGFVHRVFGPRWQLLLIGAGHLSDYVAQIALMLDYHVMVCDPRDSYAQGGLEQNVERLRCMPDEAVQTCADNPRSVVLALTHDPRLDDMALLDALQSTLFYVGAIGSKLNSEKRRERLKTLGVTAAQLRGLHAPVGLPIGSRSPPEIAVSIMAEITALRHQARQLARDTVTAA